LFSWPSKKISEPNSSVVVTSTEASSSTVMSMLSRLDEGDAMAERIVDHHTIHNKKKINVFSSYAVK
jgi:hypothetical protein